MMLTMIAPEYTFWVASGQRSVAIKSLEQLRRYGSWNWTATHAFYASMGGFVLVDKEYPEARFPISVEEVIQLLKDKKLPLDCVELLQNLDREEIDDRSKANSLAKGLACVQLVWLALQCTARAAQHLPFTLLELVTVAEAVITIGTYLMWWNKPLDVTSTIDLRISGASTLASSICNPVNFRYNHYQLWGAFIAIDSSVHRIRNGFRIAGDPENGHRPEGNANESLSVIESPHSPNIFIDRGPAQERVSENFDALDVRPDNQLAMMTSANLPHQTETTQGHDIESSETHLQELFISDKLNVVENSPPTETKATEVPASESQDPNPIPSAQAASVPATPNQDQSVRTETQSSLGTPVGSIHNISQDWRVTIEVTAPFFEASFLAVGFGGLHAAAWNFYFPTIIERKLWRISSLILVISLPAYFLCYLFIRLSSGDDSPQRRAAKRVVAILISWIYVLARTFTLAECLVSLRKQPVGVYEAVEWTLLFPHF